MQQKNTKHQSIDYAALMKGIRQLIVDSEYREKARGLQELNKAKQSKGLNIVRNAAFANNQKAMKDLTDKDFNELFDSYIEEIDDSSGRPLSWAVQKKISRSVWQNLLSPDFKSEHDFLFDHGYIVLMSRLEMSLAEGILQRWEAFMYEHMDNLIEAGSDQAKEIIIQMNQYPLDPPVTFYPSNVFIKMASEVTHEMLGCLLRLPYSKYYIDTWPGQNNLSK